MLKLFHSFTSGKKVNSRYGESNRGVTVCDGTGGAEDWKGVKAGVHKDVF